MLLGLVRKKITTYAHENQLFFEISTRLLCERRGNSAAREEWEISKYTYYFGFLPLQISLFAK